jgi:arsenite-transporting ATPase
MIGGKGGVGKTTLAAAYANALSAQYKTLLVSTDPAHSIAHLLEKPHARDISNVPGKENLFFWEIDSEEALESFKNENQEQLRLLMDSSSYLEEEDIDQVLKLTIPGIDEIMGFKAISDIHDSEEFERIVVDTAPTGHALRLLGTPELLNDWIKMMAQMRWKYRFIQKTFKGKYKKDDADDLLMQLKRTVVHMRNLLQKEDLSEFIIVTKAEKMILSETSELVKKLQSAGIHTDKLLINNVMEVTDNDFCKRVRSNQEKYFKQIETEFADFSKCAIPTVADEIVGLKSLEELTKEFVK